MNTPEICEEWAKNPLRNPKTGDQVEWSGKQKSIKALFHKSSKVETVHIQAIRKVVQITKQELNLIFHPDNLPQELRQVQIFTNHVYDALLTKEYITSKLELLSILESKRYTLTLRPVSRLVSLPAKKPNPKTKTKPDPIRLATPLFQPVDEPDPKPIPQPKPQLVNKPAPKPMPQVKTRLVNEPAPKPMLKDNNQPINKPAPKPMSKDNNQSINEPAPKPMPQVKTRLVNEPAPKPMLKDNNQSLNKPAPKPMSKDNNQSINEPAPKPMPQVKTRLVNEPAPKPMLKDNNQPINEPAPKPMLKDNNQPINKPAPKPMSKDNNQSINEPAPKPMPQVKTRLVNEPAPKPMSKDNNQAPNPPKLLDYKELQDKYLGLATKYPISKRDILLKFHPDKLPRELRNQMKNYENVRIFTNRVFNALLISILDTEKHIFTSKVYNILVLGLDCSMFVDEFTKTFPFVDEVDCNEKEAIKKKPSYAHSVI